jgi:CDP-diacylglycerol--glycerol-3-phosphate 3-phosphatidyltransferase
MFDKRCRTEVERGLRPVGSGIVRVGVTADQLTLAGLVMSVVSAVAVGAGRLGWAAVALASACALDILDGAVAKASGTASPRGSFYDSVVDRVSDAAVLGGFAWYLLSTHPGSHVALLPMAVMAASALVSYERAKAESLGFSARGGLMERAERMFALGACLVFSPIMVPVLWVMLVLTLVTAGHRFAMVWRQAGNRPALGARVRDGRPGWRPKAGFAVDVRARRLQQRETRRRALKSRGRLAPGSWRARSRP